ncbi:5614_t:CDS:2, partial [Paraglomus occultum]
PMLTTGSTHTISLQRKASGQPLDKLLLNLRTLSDTHDTPDGKETRSNKCGILQKGIGFFTVVDGRLVTGADIGNNFFLTLEALGQPRAAKVTEYLQELNEDVKGSSLVEDPINLIETSPDYFLQFSLVIATELPEKPLLRLAQVLWDSAVPLVVVRSTGFIGYFRIVKQEHTSEYDRIQNLFVVVVGCSLVTGFWFTNAQVVETHPENVIDLRLDKPIPELEAYAQTFDFEGMDNMDHGHIPYVVILVKYLNQWKKEHNGELPKGAQERNLFKETILSGKRSSDEENFDEAIASIWKACTPTQVPSKVQVILNDPLCDNITVESSNFWIIARAVREFVANEGLGLLPLSGKLPDMKAYTQSYVNLQNIYRQKARQDVTVVHARVNKILSSLGRPADSISNEEIESFCKNAAYIEVIRYRSLQEEYISDPKKEDINRWLRDPEDSIAYYVLFRAMDRFYETFKRYPDGATLPDSGDDEDDGEGNNDEQSVTPGFVYEFNPLKKIVTSLLEEWGIDDSGLDLDDYIHEMSGGSELPNMAALLGGLVSQEIIKLITHQYIPLNNSCIFDGIKASSRTYVL